MVVCHFFLREVKRRTYLMVEAAVSGGSESPWTTATVVKEVGEGETVADWLFAAREAAKAAHPGHGLGDVTTHNGRDSRRFDIVLKKRPATLIGRLLKK